MLKEGIQNGAKYGYNWTVLILILMEHAQRVVLSTYAVVSCATVLILILMEHAQRAS